MKTLIAMFILFLPCMTTAQENFLQKDTLAGGEIKFMRLNPRTMPLPLTSSRTFLRSSLRMSYDDELRWISTRKDDIGYDLEFYEQYYNGVPVEYGAYSVHAKNGIVETIFGNYRKIDIVTGLGQSTEKSGLINDGSKEHFRKIIVQH